MDHRSKADLIRDIRAERVPSPATIGRRARMQAIAHWFGSRRFSKRLAAEGMSRDSLGEDYVKRMELAGLSTESLDRTLSRVRSLQDWPRMWELEGDRLLADGELMGASAAYYMAQRWTWIQESDQARLYEKAVEIYQRLEHAAPLEPFQITSGSRTIAGLLQVPISRAADQASEPHPTVVIFPGLSGTKEEGHPLAEEFLALGIAVCRVDLPGYGETSGYMTEDPDVLARAVIQHLSADPRLDSARIHAMGFCTGGMYAAGAALDTDVASVTLVSTPVAPLPYLDRQPPGMINALKKTMGCSSVKEIAEALARMKLVVAPRIQCPIVLIYGGQDDMIPPSEMNRVIAYAPGEVTPIFFPEQPHACVGRFADIVEIISDQVTRTGGASSQEAAA